jgi:hypothetical protein
MALPSRYGIPRVMRRIGKANLLFYLCAVMLVASLILGGGTRSGFLSDAILQLLAIPLLLASLWRVFDVPLTRQMRLALPFCLAIAVLPLVQLVPLPPWLWTALPNRQPSAEAFDIVSHTVPWMPISVSPQATWLSALSVVPPLAIFLATLLLPYRERRWLSLVVIVVGIVSVFVGLVQVAQGHDSPLRFFEMTNPTDAVGFFANRNHFAALLYCLMLFAVAWTVQTTAVGRVPRNQKKDEYATASIVASIGAFTALVILLAGEFTTRSRAGLGLTMVALFGALALGFSDRRASSRGTHNKKLLLGAVALAVTFSLQFALYRVLDRASDPIQDDRPIFAGTTIEAANAYMPLGSGLGTFVPIYAMFEKPENASEAYVNHAHNDILEVWLETGALGLGLMGLFAVWLVRRSVEIWRSPPVDGANELDWSLARAATIAVALIVAHSYFDYPLRTAAMMAIMAFACALLIEPPVGAECRDRQELEVAPEKARHHGTRRLAPVASPALPTSTMPQPTMPPPSPKPLGAPSVPPDQQWGTNVDWPEEWSKSSKPCLPGDRDRAPNFSKTPKN